MRRSKDESGSTGRQAPASRRSIQPFVEEVRRFVIRMRGMAEMVHGVHGPADRQKALLMDLEHLGPSTIPQLVRYRPVSRQRIQALVQELMEKGWLTQRPNPAHQRSHLLELSTRGREMLGSMKLREEAALAALNLSFSPAEWEALTAGLRHIREALDKAMKEENFFARVMEEKGSGPGGGRAHDL